MVPENLRYTATHEWCRIEGESIIIGLTENAVAPLGNLIYVELPEVGDDVLAEVPFGEIEGMRGVKDLVSPADGHVAEVNSGVVMNPDVLSKDPYGQGWLIRLKPDPSASLDNLLSTADYQNLLRKRKGK